MIPILFYFLLFLFTPLSFAKKDSVPSIKQKEEVMERAFKSQRGFLTSVSQVLSEDADHQRALHLLGVYHLNRRQWGLARIIMERIIEKHPRSASAHYHLGIIALKEKNKDEAMLLFKKSLRYDADYFPSLAHLSALYLEYADFPKARSLLEKAYAHLKKPPYTQYYVPVAGNYAVHLQWSNQKSKARRIYQELIKKSKVSSSTFIDYARLLIDLDKKGEALEMLDYATLRAKSSTHKKQIKKLRQQIKRRKK